MRRLLLVALLGAVAPIAGVVTPAVALAAPAPPAYDPSDLVGRWLESNGRVTQIGWQKGKLAVLSIVDGDGEVFVPKKAKWVDGQFRYAYFVPSTKYVVTYEVLSVRGGVASYRWWNNHKMSGTDELHAEAPPPGGPVKVQ